AECGKPPTYAPCVSFYESNKAFRQCCIDLGISNCKSACTYDISMHKKDGLFGNSTCTYDNLPKLIFCASNGYDNRPCCKDLKVKSSKPKCIDFCHFRRIKENGLTLAHEECLSDIPKILRCHRAGLKKDDLF
ncbi:unnamed protein product, partial [Soboliphyme baturini]|uniref:DB domain-containing protein n=1 Tax=Soboliphyme baturini TaxID=241478 RepID=A0A183IAF4_9BILA